MKKNKKKTVKTSRYDWSSHTNNYISSQYTGTVINKYDTLQEISERHTPNNEYENFLDAHTEAIAECKPTIPRAKCRVPWKSIAVREKLHNMEKSIISQ